MEQKISLRIALYQGTAVPLHLEYNLELIDQAAAEASRGGADLLVTPELFATGYAPSMIRQQLSEKAVAATHEELASIARRHRVGMVHSLPGYGPPEDRGITASLLDSTGELLTSYQKVQLFGPKEKAAFVPGSKRPPVVDFRGLRVGLLICYDLEFPELARATATGGAQLITVPTALPTGAEEVSTTLVPARALENRVTIAYANHTGTEAGITFEGASVLAGPQGESTTASSEPGLLFSQVRPAPAPGRSGPWYLLDRRPDLYKQWVATSQYE